MAIIFANIGFDFEQTIRAFRARSLDGFCGGVENDVRVARPVLVKYASLLQMQMPDTDPAPPVYMLGAVAGVVAVVVAGAGAACPVSIGAFPLVTDT
eukprot:scaffold495_cov243-Pinguiococcus_pyrenoidosus.AAC.32